MRRQEVGGWIHTTEHVKEHDKEVIQTMQRDRSRSVAMYHLRMLAFTTEQIAHCEDVIRLVESKPPEIAARMESLVLGWKAELKEKQKEFDKTVDEIKGFYASVLQEEEIICHEDGRRSRQLSRSSALLYRRISSLLEGDGEFKKQLAEHGFSTKWEFTNALKTKALPLEVFILFLQEMELLFNKTEAQLRELVQPLREEFLREALSPRAKKYVSGDPDIIKKRLKQFDVYLLDELNPDNQKKSGHFEGGGVGFTDDTLLAAEGSEKGKEWFRNVVFHEFAHAVDGAAFVKNTSTIAESEISPLVSILVRRSGLSFDKKASTWINEAKTELLAAFLGKFNPRMYPAEREIFWKIVDAGVSLEVIFGAAAESTDVYAPPGSKAPAFRRLAEEISSATGGPGGLKRYAEMVKRIKYDPDHIPPEDIRELPE